MDKPTDIQKEINKPCGVPEKYYGKYIVTDGFFSTEVIAFDKNPTIAMAEAKKKKPVFPVIVFVPEKDITEIY